jgi:hypothetical protein
VAATPKGLGSASLSLPSVRRPFTAPSFLVQEGQVRPKLIKKIIIIDFTLQNKSMFFSIVIKFISNLINLLIFMILIIPLNLSTLIFYSF